MPHVDEHQAPSSVESDNASRTYEPTSEEKQALRLVNDLMVKSKSHRALYDDKWGDYYKFFRGNQWKENRPTYRHKEVINSIFKTIQSLVPIQTEFRPNFEFLPKEPQDYELSQILNVVAATDWDQNNWSDDLLEIIYDANIFGTGCSSMEWDGDKDKITYQSEDPYTFFPDPFARDVNKNSQWFLKACPEDIKFVKRKYPKLAAYLKPDLIDLLNGLQRSGAPTGAISVPFNSTMLIGNTKHNSLDAYQKDQILVQYCYINPEYLLDEFEEIAEVKRDPDTGVETQLFVQKARWPNGRKLVVANGVVLYDDANPYADGLFPYHRYCNYILPREFWGASEVEQLMGPQRIFNKLYSFALDCLSISGNPLWVVPTSSGVDPELLTNRPGLNVEYDGERPPERLAGLDVPQGALNLAQTIMTWMDEVSGSTQMSRGIAPAGVTAAKALGFLQDSSNTRIRQKSKILDRYIQSVGQQYVNRVFQFYTAPRVFRLTGNKAAAKYFQEGQENQYLKMGIEHHEDGKKSALVMPLSGDGTVDIMRTKRYMIAGEFDVSVTTGSSLPFAKQERKDEALALFDRGIYDIEEVLDAVDAPNKE